MPDAHWGYGFPIGGVAATDIDADGVVSPGGVDFDISCGVRLLVSDLDRQRLQPRIRAVMDRLDVATPRGWAPRACGGCPTEASWSGFLPVPPGTRSNRDTASHATCSAAKTVARTGTASVGTK